MNYVTFETWSKPFEMDSDTLEYLRSRPLGIQRLMLQFPPDCRVVANRPLDCPRFWEVGMISSYLEADGGTVTVIVPGRGIRAECKPEWLKVVAYRPGFEPEKLRKVFGG